MIGPIDTETSATEFQKNFKRHMRLAATGRGPIRVLNGKDVVGVFLAEDDYDALFVSALRGLLRSRQKGRTIPQGEAQERIRQLVQKVHRKT